MKANKKTTLVTAVTLLLASASTFAAAANPLDKSPVYNWSLIGLVGIIVILLFVIGVLAGILRQLSFATRDQIRKNKSDAVKNIVKAILILIALLPATSAFAAEDTNMAAQTIESIDGIPATEYYVIVGVIALELFVIFSMVVYINMLLKVIRNLPEPAANPAHVAKKSWFWDKFNAAATLEKENDVLLDHNYDGIMELDNSLPPWWKYGFYLTIVVAIIYVYRFHISHDGPSQQEEYIAEMQKGEEEKAAYLAVAANNIDENNVTFLSGAPELAAGKEIYLKACVACHLADGGGSVGPNFTDDYWLHGGSIKDIFKSIKYGWQDKGMKSWKDDYSPKEMQLLASFIKSLKGSKSATPKDAQGDLYIEATSSASVDSTDKTETPSK